MDKTLPDVVSGFGDPLVQEKSASSRTFLQNASSKSLTEPMVRNDTRYIIRPTSESSVAAQIFKSGLMASRKHVLFLQQYSGEVDYDSENPENSRIQLVFDATSVVCRDQWLKPEKRQSFLAFVQKEILAADDHEKITFSSNRINRISSTRFQLEGTLNLRGHAKPVLSEVVVIRNGKDRLEIDGTAQLRMSDFGIDWPTELFGLIGTKDEVVLRFLLWPERTAAVVPKKTAAAV
jgi:polyisoprenoid-binding protein YceI